MRVLIPANQSPGAAAFTRVLGSMLVSKGYGKGAVMFLESKFPGSAVLDNVKAAVTAGTTLDGSWAGPLSPLGHLGRDFVAYLQPRTVVGRMAASMRRVPFDTKVPRATSASSVGWVGQGRPTMVSKLSFDSVTAKITKIGGIIVVTQELAQMKTPVAEALLRDDLAGAIASFTDDQFLDPTVAEVAGEHPGSITNGATAIASGGFTAAQVEADFRALFDAVTTNLLAPFLVMQPRTAFWLATLRSSGSRVFPDVTAAGGDIWGVPVIVSRSAPLDGNSPARSIVALIDAAEVLLADDGDVEFDASEQATIEMDSGPTDPVSGSSLLTSLWANGLVGIKATRFVNWARRQPGSVAYITGLPA